jgi:hypothetical protein
MIFKKASDQVTKCIDEKSLATCYSAICDEKEKAAEICFNELERILLSEIKTSDVKLIGLEGFLRTCNCSRCKE